MLSILTVEGKLYLDKPEWPERFDATREWLNALDKQRTQWNGDTLKLWVENGNAAYSVTAKDGDLVSFGATYRSAVTAIPGKVDLPAPPSALAVPEGRTLHVPKFNNLGAIPVAGFVPGLESGYALQQLLRQGAITVSPPTAGGITGIRTTINSIRSSGTIFPGHYSPPPVSVLWNPVTPADLLGDATHQRRRDLSAIRRELEQVQNRLMLIAASLEAWEREDNGGC